MLIACTCYSQDSYPRQVVIDGDTVEAISRSQMITLISLQYAYDACDSIQYLQSGEITALEKISQRQDSTFHGAQEEIQGYDAEVRLLNQRITGKDDELKVNKDLLLRQKIGTIAGGVTGTAVAVAVGFIVGFFIHH